MVVEVTWKDIDGGTPRSSEFCPIALAIKRKQRKHVTVGPDCLYLDRHGTKNPSILYLLPSEATDWIRDFDRNQPVTPITFTVRSRRP